MEFLEYELKRLKPYCVDIQYIDGLLTFIIAPSKYENILKDKEILNLLYKSEKEINQKISSIIKNCISDNDEDTYQKISHYLRLQYEY